MKNKTSYDLLCMSVKTCNKCNKWKSDDCPEYTGHNKHNGWSTMRACRKWTPNENADAALQELTMRKLEGQDVTYYSDEGNEDY